MTDRERERERERMERVCDRQRERGGVKDREETDWLSHRYTLTRRQAAAKTDRVNKNQT